MVGSTKVGPEASNRWKAAARQSVVLLLPIILLTAEASSVRAETPLEAYVSSRDQYVAIWQGEQSEGGSRQEADDLADLERQLHRIIGPSRFDGMAVEGKINLELSGPFGVTKLDALVYTTPDGRISIYVTTPALLASWLREHEEDLPQDSAAALRSGAFYTRAISYDAAIYNFAKLPVAVPAGATMAYAMLGTQTQDITWYSPDLIVAAVIRADKVFILTEKLPTEIEVPAACDHAVRALRQSTDSDVDLEQRELAYQQCFAEHVAELSAYGALVQTAQSLVNRTAAD